MDGNEYDIEHENKQKCHIPQETRVDQVGSLVVLPSQPADLILKVHVHLCNLTTIGRILEGYWQLASLQNVHHTLLHTF